MPESLADDDLLTEFLTLVRDVRAHVEWHGTAGTIGLPRDPDAKGRVEAFWREQTPAASEEVVHERSASGVSRSAPRSPDPEWERAFEPPAERPSSPQARGGAERGAPAASARAPKDQAVPEPRPVQLPQAYASVDDLRAAVRACTKCDLHKERTQTVFSRGTGSSGICFIGEGPGADEDAQGEPFVGAAGQLLDKMIAAMGLGRDEVYVCNIVKCRPPNNRRPEPGEMAACSGFLRSQLEFLNPEVIVALGGTAVSGLLGLTDGITRIRGTFRLYDGRIPVMPTFHPSYLLRTPGAKREVWADLKAVLAHLGRTA